MFEQQGTIDVLEHDTQSGTAYGHANAANVASIGASSWYLTEEFDAYFSTLVQDAPGACVPACLNDFSSAGGIPTYLDKYGAPLAAARAAAESARHRSGRRQHDVLPRRYVVRRR